MSLPGPHDQTDTPARRPLSVKRALPEILPLEPFGLFVDWFNEARDLLVQPNPSAFSLATVDQDGHPSVRIVLCKSIDAAGGHIVFHTNYQGRKGRALESNPFAAACFHWDELDRQVRIEALVAKSPAEESDAYFRSRPWASRAGAWASDQSQPIANRDELKDRLHAVYRRFGIDPERPPPSDAQIDIPRPPHWGGYRLYARAVELWIGAESRLHDRARWTRDLVRAPGRDDPAFTPATGWVSTRLQP